MDKKIKTFNSTQAVAGYTQEKIQDIADYFSLASENRQLNRQLAEKNNQSFDYVKLNKLQLLAVTDSVYKQQYYFYPAKIINNSIDKRHNYLTLNVGAEQGITSDMGVISTVNNSVVGIVRDVSPNFASVISILNEKLGVSAKVKRNQYSGSLVWDGYSYKYARLKEIPNHVDLFVGDTIITSGYSAIFPEGFLLGFIDEFEKNTAGSFYEIKVKLATDFKSVSSVNVVGNVLRLEQLELESNEHSNE